MQLTSSKTLAGMLVLLAVAGGTLIPASRAGATTTEFPQMICQMNRSAVEIEYVCPISVDASTKSLKAQVYLKYYFQPSSTSAGKPFDSTANCTLYAWDRYGSHVGSASASIVLPTAKHADGADATLSLPSVPTLHGGYFLICLFPLNDENHFLSELDSFKVIAQ
jgi:hypothetical protein